ncbi:MAG: gliding motility-associated C-terminal domain-containing protein [Bacteroidota bacterium]
MYDALGLLVNTSDGKQIGSSIYLTASGANNAVDLSWTEYVPWFNSSYEIHRSDNGGPFLPVATVTGTGQNVHTYLDEGLNPNVEYCYFIRSIGTHMEDGVKDPLINDSQKDCAYARDEEPPCPPFISATGECEALSHTLTISKSELACGNDTDSVIVVFGFSQQGPFDKRFSLGYNQFGQDTTIILDLTGREEDLAGCYAAYSIDTLGNVGPLSEPACIDFCPVLIMSNVFTPNNDGINDVFKPKLFRDVRLREIKIFDRWGRPMWTTNGDFSNLWQGQVDFSNQMANEGVYYYYLRYEELGIGGNVLKEMTGWVTLLR